MNGAFHLHGQQLNLIECEMTDRNSNGLRREQNQCRHEQESGTEVELQLLGD